MKARLPIVHDEKLPAGNFGPNGLKSLAVSVNLNTTEGAENG